MRLQPHLSLNEPTRARGEQVQHAGQAPFELIKGERLGVDAREVNPSYLEVDRVCNVAQAHCKQHPQASVTAKTTPADVPTSNRDLHRLGSTACPTNTVFFLYMQPHMTRSQR